MPLGSFHVIDRAELSANHSAPKRIRITSHPLSDLLVGKDKADVLKKLAASMPDITLNNRQVCDFGMLTTGSFTPLNGFMKQINYESVLDRMRLEPRELWPVPICLDIHDSIAATLRDPVGFFLGILNIEDKWEVDIEKEAETVYGTTEIRATPGVAYLYNRPGR